MDPYLKQLITNLNYECMPVHVKHYLAHQKVADPTSPMAYHLRQVADAEVDTIESIAQRIQKSGALSVNDVVHTMREFVDELKLCLVKGHRVKVDKLGTFYLTFHSNGAPTEEASTTRSINHLRVRFLPDKGLKLENASTAFTRTENTVEFAIDGGSGGVTPATELTITGLTVDDVPVAPHSGVLTLLSGETLKIEGTALSPTAIQVNYATSVVGTFSDKPLSDIGTASGTSTLITVPVTITRAIIKRIVRVDNGAILYDLETES
jgi:predicted histone-like DNA-binding protein